MAISEEIAFGKSNALAIDQVQSLTIKVTEIKTYIAQIIAFLADNYSFISQIAIMWLRVA